MEGNRDAGQAVSAPAITLAALKDMSVSELTRIAKELDIPGAGGRREAHRRDASDGSEETKEAPFHGYIGNSWQDR